MKTMQKKSGSGWIVAAAVALALLPGACFNPLNDAEDGMGTIDFGVSNALALVGPAEAADLRYDLVLSGPGGTITRTLEPGSGLSCSIKVVPGLWEVAVRAYDAEGLRGMGFTTVEAKAGQNTPAQVGMNTTTAVSNWDDLKNAIEHADTENGEYFLVAAELEADSAISVDDHITIIADGHRIINRKTTHTGAFFEVASGGELNLRHGFPGGSLILDGREVPGVSDALVVVSDGDLVMEGNVSLRNNVARGGVGMYGGSFIMNGGTISGNRTTTNGGGVYVNNGIFTMNGGTISNNEAAFGGGVYVLGGGIFNMSQGTVSGNKAGSRGGGVYVGMSGTFTKTGGIIYGDTDTTHTPNSTENTAASGNGHAVYVSSTKKRDSTAGAGINLD
ncbi:MAG: hypothetical protein LBP29_07300, partial [Treponema sp.]|nr:hypothetical protein [Treponema sp.]